MKSVFKVSSITILTALALLVNAFGAVPAYAAVGPTARGAAGEPGMSNNGAQSPTAPVVNQPPSFTNDTTPLISGTAEEGSRVNVWYLDALGVPVQICKDVRVDDDDDRDADSDDDESGNWSCTSSVVLPEGEIELVVNATDRSGHTSADTSYVFTVDATAPAMPVITGPPAITNDTTPVISGTAEGGSLVNVWYLDDLGAPAQICEDIPVDQSGSWSCTSSVVLPEREIELVVNVTDAAGNTSDDASFTFTVDTTVVADTTPPTVSSITLASPNPPTSSTVNYTVTFSEAVTSVDTGDFTLNSSGTLSGATVSNVTGSGAVYTVTANTGSGTGALRLDIPATATINDLAGNPLAGLPYAGGASYTVPPTVLTFEAETIGVYRPIGNAWYLRNSNSSGPPNLSAIFGIPGDYQIVGDWDGNGTDTIGVYRNGVFYLSNSNTASTANIVFAFGAPGDQPIAGDWDGDGIDTVGLYRSATITFYLRNTNSMGTPDITISFGIPGDVGIAGDWDGDGTDTIGVYRPGSGEWYFRNSNTSGVADLAFTYGLVGDLPVKADWNNDGIDTVGVYRNNVFYLSNSNSTGFADLVIPYGSSGDLPIAGNWDGLP